jgi:hypothetical protein
MKIRDYIFYGAWIATALYTTALVIFGDVPKREELETSKTIESLVTPVTSAFNETR